MKSTLKELTFKDFITLQRGFDLPKKERVEGDYPVVASTSIQGHHAEYKVKPPGVVTGRSGSLGKVIYLKNPFWPLNTVLWVRDFKNNLPKYVYYFLQTLGLENYNSGAGVPTLNRNHLDTLEIAIHEIRDQRKIAIVLSAYDDLIENNLRRIKILEEMAQLIYREWFVKFRFPGHKKVKMVNSELGMIPEGWEARSVRNFGEVITGKTPSKKRPEYYDGEIPFIKTPDMHGSLFVIQTADRLSTLGADSQPAKTIPENSLCVSCIGTVGVVSLTGQPAQTNQQINSLVLENQENREFLYFALVDLRETIKRFGATGATMSNLSKGKFKSLRIICPNQNMIKAFHKRTSGMFNIIKVLQYKNINLRKTRGLLLPKLISGELDVSELEIDIGEETA